MSIYYLLGGEDVKKRTSIEINVRAFQDAGGNPRIVVLPWTTEDEEKRNKYNGIIEDYFKDIKAREIIFLYPHETQDKIKKEINSSDLVYIPGGLSEIFMKYVKGKNLKKILLNFKGVIIGNSAGAMVLCKDIVITKDREHKMTKVIEGLGLINSFSIDVHYEPSHDKELKELSIERIIYGIPENCAIKYVKNKNTLEYFGNIYMFKEAKKRKIN